MATLSITEYEGLAESQPDRAGKQQAMPAPAEPALTRQVVSYTTVASSAAFGTNTRFIRVAASGDLYYEIGTAPNDATAGSTFLPSGAIEYIGVKAGDIIKAYDGAS